MMPSAPAAAISLAMRRTRSSSTSPSIVQPKLVARPQLIRGRLAPPRSRHNSTTRRKSAIDSSVLRRTFERLWPSLTDSTKFISCTPRARPRSAPREFGISADTVSSGKLSACLTTASASASCGSSFGGTKELTSISRTPAAYSASSQASLVSVGMIPAILDEFGWERGVTTGAFSFGFLVSAVITPWVGRLLDLRGPRLVIEIGVFTMGAGLLLATVIREPWQLYLTLGALVGGGVNCLAYTGQSLYLTKWFVRRRGLALSIAFSGVGIGSITVLPWLQSLIAAAGWRTACGALGLLVLGLLAPLNLLLRRRPEDLGLEPDGERAWAANSSRDRNLVD